MNPNPGRHNTPFLDKKTVEEIAQRVGTPFYLYKSEEIRARIAEIRSLMDAPGLRARFAMKSCSTRRVLEEFKAQDMWLDTVSGNEILRAKRVGFPMGSTPPVLLYTADVFRDNALEVVVKNQILPTIGTYHMVDELIRANYRGPVGIRLNPGFGHGHVQQCDTGGPASKHGIWHEDEATVRNHIGKNGFRITYLHSHIGTGAEIAEFQTNVSRLADFFMERIKKYPDLEAVNFGGGIPHPYRPGAPRIDLEECGRTLQESQEKISLEAGREIRVEIEPGRYMVASGAALVTRVRGVKDTRTNEKGPGHHYIMVDAGFCDLVRPAMYGAYHHIEVLGKDHGPFEPQILAGPLCESGDIFTRDSEELLAPRSLPPAEVDDLVLIHDAGAYGIVMSSSYNSIGQVPQVWMEGGKAFLISRRQTLDDLTRTECFEEL